MIGTQIRPSKQRELSVERRNDGDGVTLAVSGEIDLASAPTLRRALQRAERPGLAQIAIDLAGLGFIDSSGLRLLVEAQERADRNGHRLVLRNVPARARQLIGMIGLDEQIVIE